MLLLSIMGTQTQISQYLHNHAVIQVRPVNVFVNHYFHEGLL